MKMNSSVVRRRNGFVSVYVVMTSLILIPIVGLAIDFNVLYNVKAKLQSAVDAAAIGSGSMLQSSTDLDDKKQVDTVKDAAQRYFTANYPAGYWRTTQAYYTASATEDGAKVRTVSVKAAMYVPMLFMRVIGIKNSTVAAQAAVKVRFVSMMVVVDRSGSVVRGGADPFSSENRGQTERFAAADKTFRLSPVFAAGSSQMLRHVLLIDLRSLYTECPN